MKDAGETLRPRGGGALQRSGHNRHNRELEFKATESAHTRTGQAQAGQNATMDRGR